MLVWLRICMGRWTHDMSCSIEDSTSLPLSDFKNEGRPGVRVTVAPGMMFLYL